MKTICYCSRLTGKSISYRFLCMCSMTNEHLSTHQNFWTQSRAAVSFLNYTLRYWQSDDFPNHIYRLDESTANERCNFDVPKSPATPQARENTFQLRNLSSMFNTLRTSLYCNHIHGCSSTLGPRFRDLRL